MRYVKKWNNGTWHVLDTVQYKAVGNARTERLADELVDKANGAR